MIDDDDDDNEEELIFGIKKINGAIFFYVYYKCVVLNEKWHEY
jgi:hypothetical protein